MEKRNPKSADPIGDNVELDGAVMAKLPPGCSVLSVTPSGKSLWVATVKIVVQLPDGNTVEFFKKGASGARGVDMMKGTFEAEQSLYGFYPDNVPKPVAWGTYINDPDTHFYLCEFVELHDNLPSPPGWASTVSRLHLNSMGKSPTGEFGFHVSTHLANVPLDNTWNPSWSAFWAQQMRGLFDREEAVRGLDEELSSLKTSFLERAIPTILGPLQEEGHSINPCLIHSDLWSGNIKPRKSTGKLCIFDACAYWGHNEADLGICRNPRYKLGTPCIREYVKHMPISEPVGDFDKRNAVYAMKYHALLSILYPKEETFRKILIDELEAVMAMIELEPSGAKTSSRL